MKHILTITGSDNTSTSGLQLDVRMIWEMGAEAMTTATCVMMGLESFQFPPTVIARQIESVIRTCRPDAVKVGLIKSPEAVFAIEGELRGCRNLVVAPGIIASNGTQIVDNDTIRAMKQGLLGRARLLVLRQAEAEIILGMRISTNEEMLMAARSLTRLGAEYVMLRGARTHEARLTALLASEHRHEFFSTYNIEGWQQHGVGGAMSTAIATRLGMGDDVPTAVKNAHDYIHSRIVYTSESDGKRLRQSDLYNAFMSLLAAHYKEAHDVNFYASQLNVSQRYLSMITNRVVQKAPKVVIAEYLVQHAKLLLEGSRLSIKEVAHELGFRSESGFCTFFRQQTGLSPTQHRLPPRQKA